MPITGLPDPAIHRKCKRCGVWFHHHEGTMTWPPKRGLLSLIHVTLAESADQERQLKFYCVACQELNDGESRSFRRMSVSLALTAVVLTAMVAIAYGLGLFAWMETAFQRP